MTHCLYECICSVVRSLIHNINTHVLKVLVGILVLPVLFGFLRPSGRTGCRARTKMVGVGPTLSIASAATDRETHTQTQTDRQTDRQTHIYDKWDTWICLPSSLYKVNLKKTDIHIKSQGKAAKCLRWGGILIITKFSKYITESANERTVKTDQYLMKLKNFVQGGSKKKATHERRHNEFGLHSRSNLMK